MTVRDTKGDKELDIKGEVCPYTLVWTKLALDEMESGQVLRIVLDHIPATVNVPRSLTAEGHRVLDVSRIGDIDWQILVEKA